MIARGKERVASDILTDCGVACALKTVGGVSTFSVYTQVENKKSETGYAERGGSGLLKDIV
jgi:hypothetical protein